MKARGWRGQPRPTRRAWLCALALAWATAAGAQGWDFLATEGKMPTEDFYRLIACRAMPGGPCETEVVRWPDAVASDLRVGFARVSQDYPPRLAQQMDSALDEVIAEINGAGSAVQLSRAGKKGPSQITIHLTPATEGQPIRGTGIRGVDGEIIGAALVTVWWDEDNRLTEATIVMAADLPPAEVLPVLLEEMAQSLGLLTDIRNPYYVGRSVFSEDSNSARMLSPQDRLVLQIHYPPRGGPQQE